MSCEAFYFNFKFVYFDGPLRLCAYINHRLSYEELKSFIDYWVCTLKSVPLVPPSLFWTDSDGDNFTVNNVMEYNMFRALNKTHAVLFGTSNGVKRLETSNILQYKHICYKCYACQRNEYLSNAEGRMSCAECANDLGYCCLFLTEGSNTIKDISTLIDQMFDENNDNQVLPAVNNCIGEDQTATKIFDNYVETILALNGKNPENQTAAKNLLEDYMELAGDLNLDGKNLVLKDEIQAEKKEGNMDVHEINKSLEKMYIDDKDALVMKQKKSTGAIPKIRKNATKQSTVKNSVDSSLQVMISMGFDNENNRLTKLLQSTNGNIDIAIEKLSTNPKIYQKNAIREKY